MGAGPAGCAAALKLRKFGINTLIIERKKIPNRKSSDSSIEEYIQYARREGMHDDEILAQLVEEGIKPGHAAMMLKRL